MDIFSLPEQHFFFLICGKFGVNVFVYDRRVFVRDYPKGSKITIGPGFNPYVLVPLVLF